jgi:hypothetical protein
MVLDNNISLFHGGNGIKAYNNAGELRNAAILFRHNTTYGNERGGVNGGICTEIGLQNSLSSEVFANLAVTRTGTGCSGRSNVYALQVLVPDSTDHLYNNFGFSAAGNNIAGSGFGFSFDASNTLGRDPRFVNPVQPPAPSCSGASNVPSCMSTVIINFTPQMAEAVPYGYQAPSATQVYDPLFPRWLCNVNLPPGLVTMGCLSGSTAPTDANVQ